MTKEEHLMLQQVHQKILGLPDKKELSKAKCEIIRKITRRQDADEETDVNGPTNNIRRAQIHRVKELVLKAYYEGRAATLSQLCLDAWEPIKGGYPTPKALYEYCHAHAELF